MWGNDTWEGMGEAHTTAVVFADTLTAEVQDNEHSLSFMDAALEVAVEDFSVEIQIQDREILMEISDE